MNVRDITCKNFYNLSNVYLRDFVKLPFCRQRIIEIRRTSMDTALNGDVRKYCGLEICKQNRKSDVCVEFTISREKPMINVMIASVFVLLLSIVIGLHYWTNCFYKLACIKHSEWYFILSLIIVISLSIKTMVFVKKETLLVIVPVGIQFTTTYAFGRETVMFIPWSAIRDVLLVEVITRQKVLFYLAVSVLKSHPCNPKQPCEGLVTLFQNTKPRLICLQEIYRIVQNLINSKCIQEPNL